MLGELLKKLLVEVTVDTSDYDAGLDDAADTTVQQTNRMQDAFASVGKGMQSFGKDLSTYVTLPLLAFGGYSIKAASDAEEMEGKFTAVFQHMSNDVRAWAEETGDALNRSKFEIQGYAASFQDIFVPMGYTREEAASMSKQITQLGIDLASFNNEAEDVTMDSLKSAIIGNHETVRKYGVIIDEATLKQELMRMGAEKVGGVYSNLDKIQARVNLITAGTADAQGDAARTADTFANQVRGLQASFSDLAVEIGQELMPFAQALVEKLGELIDWFQGLDAETQKLVLVMAGLAAAIGPVLIILGKFVTGISAIISILPIITAGISALGVAVGTALAPITAIIAAVAAAYAAYKIWTVDTDEAREAHEELYDVIDRANEQSADTIASTSDQAKAKRDLALATREALLAQQQELAQRIRNKIEESKLFQVGDTVVHTSGREVRELQRAYEDNSQAIQNNLLAVNMLGESYSRLKVEEAESARAAEQSARAREEKAEANKKARSAAEAAAEAEKQRKADEKAAEKAIRDRIKAEEKKIETHEKLVSASAEYVSHQAALREAVIVSNDAFELARKKQELLRQGFIGSEQALTNLAQSLIDADDSLKGAQDHEAVVAAMEEEIAANEQLVSALQISTEEYMIQKKVLDMIKAGYQGTAEEARRLAEEFIGSAQRMQNAKEDRKEKDDKENPKKKTKGANDNFDIGDELSSGLTQMIQNQDFDFDDMLSNIGKSFQRSMLKAFVTDPLDAVSENLASGLKSIFSGSGGLGNIFSGTGLFAGIGGLLGGLLGKSLFGGGGGRDTPEFRAPQAGDNPYASSFAFSSSTVVNIDATGATKEFQAEIYDNLNNMLDQRDKKISGQIDKQFIERTSRGQWGRTG
jgi:hypothetical protein